MCTADPNYSWHYLHFLLIGLTTFSHPSVLLYGDQLVIESVLILLASLPIIFIQFKIGALAKKSIYGLLQRYFPLLRGVAIALVFQLFISGTYSPMAAVHAISAGFAVLSDEREMTSCANHWNTQSCAENSSSRWLVPDAESPFHQYVENVFYQYDGYSFDVLGGFNRTFPIFPLILAVTWLLLFIIVAIGPRVMAWVISVLGGFAMLVMLAVLGYGWSQMESTAYRGLKASYSLSGFGLASLAGWILSAQSLLRMLPLWTGILPTLGKFTKSGTVTRNIAFVFVILQMSLLRHLPLLTIHPYIQLSHMDSDKYSSVDYKYHEIFILNTPTSLRAFVYSYNLTAAFFYYLATYLHVVCQCALWLFVIVDNCLECFDWLLKKRGWNKQVVWLLTTTFFSAVMMLLGLPYATRGGISLQLTVEAAVRRVSFVTWFFLVIGLLIIYFRQTIAKGERIAIGIWVVIGSLIWLAISITRLILEWGRLSPGDAALQNLNHGGWVFFFWLISVTSFVSIFVYMLIHIVQFAKKRGQGGTWNLLQEGPGNESLERTETRNPGNERQEDVGLTELGPK